MPGQTRLCSFVALLFLEILNFLDFLVCVNREHSSLQSTEQAATLSSIPNSSCCVLLYTSQLTSQGDVVSVFLSISNKNMALPIRLCFIFSDFHSNFTHRSVHFNCGTFFWAGGLRKGNLVFGSWNIFISVSKGDKLKNSNYIDQYSLVT